jgi:S1-C subfamily serine protease
LTEAPQPPQAAVLRLEFLTGPRRGEQLAFSAATVTVGRSRVSDLHLPETAPLSTSGRHAEFEFDRGQWWLRDCESTNGTYLNGARVVREKVRSGDRVSVGDIVLKIGLGPAARSRPGRRLMLAAAAAGVGLALTLVLARSPAPQPIAERARRSVFLIALEHEGTRAIVGTAFAIAPGGVLATNAHVADAARAAAPRSVALAIHGNPDEVSRIESSVIHPDWKKGSVQNDVAIMRLAGGSAAPPLPLASHEEVQHLQRGVQLATFGFPAASTDLRNPRGRLSVDVLSDVRLPFLKIGLEISPGTSGSPVFGPGGSVVGLVVAGDFIGGGDGTTARPSGSGVNWVISVDVLRELRSDSPIADTRPR